jgi:hypothetical protein
MNKFTGTRYDPAVLEILFKTEDIISEEFIEKHTPIQAIEPSMVLKYNLFNDSHILVLPEGHVLSEVTIGKRLQFEKSQTEPMSLIVEAHQAEA